MGSDAGCHSVDRIARIFHSVKTDFVQIAPHTSVFKGEGDDIPATIKIQ